MAIKPTIFKLRISLSDLNRNSYNTLNLTIAQHPSETTQRMMARVMAYCINDQENLSFTRGLNTADDPEIWARSLDDQLELWIDIGEPSVDRIKKATRLAQLVKVYSFNSKSDVWWDQAKSKFNLLKVCIYQFEWEQIQTLASLVQRTMDFSVTITGNSAYVATASGECEINWHILQET